MDKKTRLLIVEDERIVAMDLRHRLERFGYEVVDMVASGTAAMQAVEQHHPDMVLMDIRIQGEMDGIETAGELHRRFDIPHIYLTAHRDGETINRAKHTEPFGYLLKPFNDREIQTTIEMAVYKHEMSLKLKQSELKFRSLIQNSNDIIALLGENGEINFVSPSSFRVLGYTDEELIGTDIARHLDEPSRQKLDEFLESLQQAAEPHALSMELRFLHKQKGYVFLDVVGSLFRVEGMDSGVVLNARDITDRKRDQMELVQAKNKAEEMNRLKSTFLSNISHEIRTPLTGILGFASILESELEDEQHLHMIRNITRSGLRLLETMDAVLDLALIEATRIEMVEDTVQLSTEVQQAVRLVATLAVEKSLRIKVLAKNEPQQLRLDQRLLGQVLNNVIGNAIKFTEKGSVTITIDTVTETEKGHRMRWAVVEVKDTGIGISEDFLPRIFDEFKQESTGSTRKYEGAGIGLHIAKRFLDMMGARVEVQSKLGAGTTFTMFFPIEDD
ncbi:MAG: two component signal transduction system hybrid histidine kinase / response regulator with PAS senso [Bacteroidetes bacterium HLUCCA01]|nr:MAG: two component signal transduction system hybrid histidine kinase / response regulator with PAS senso [Bacteroidetes bacterium HLUCCA01]